MCMKNIHAHVAQYGIHSYVGIQSSDMDIIDNVTTVSN